MTSVSVAMATYNGARFIGQQLASFASQTRLPNELVVTDDCSSDGTIEKVEAFAVSAPFPVRIERNPERLGYSRNFERAIGLTLGDVIMVSDQDDIWDDDKIATILGELNADPTVMATVNDQRIVDADGHDSKMTMFGNFRQARCPETDLIAGSCTAFRRSLLSLLLPFPVHLPYDSWIGACVDGLGVKRLIERSLQIYRRHGGNATEPIVASANPSRFSAFRRYGWSDPRAGWRREMEWRRDLLARLGDPLRIEPLAMEATSLIRARNINEQRIEALSHRLELLSKNRFARLPRALHLWRRGLYENFDGFLSFAKDLIRS